MSKSRRRVTVERDEDDDKKKPSVFERLGPGGMSRSYEGQGYNEKCRNWLKYGTCTFGPTCRYRHGSESKKVSPEPEDLRDRVNRKRSDRRSSSSSPKRKHSKSKKTKDSKIKSAVVISKHRGQDSEEDNWRGTGDDSELGFDEELLLEKKRLEQELSQLAEEEKRQKFEKESSDSSESEEIQYKSKKTKKMKGPKTPSPARKKVVEVKKTKKVPAKSLSPRGRTKKRAPSPESDSSSSSSSSSSASSSPSPPPPPVKDKHKKKKVYKVEVEEEPRKLHKSRSKPVEDPSPRAKKLVKAPRSPEIVKTKKHSSKRSADSSYYDDEKPTRGTSYTPDNRRSRSPESKRNYSPEPDYRSSKYEQKKTSSSAETKHKTQRKFTEQPRRVASPQETRRRRSLTPKEEKDYRSKSPLPTKHSSSSRHEEYERSERKRSPEYKRAAKSPEPYNKYSSRQDRSPDYKKQESYRKPSPPRRSVTPPHPSRERYISPERSEYRRDDFDPRKKQYPPEKESRHSDPRPPYPEKDYRTRSHERPGRELPQRPLSPPPPNQRPRSPSPPPRDRYGDPRQPDRGRDMRRHEDFRFDMPPRGGRYERDNQPFGLRTPPAPEFQQPDRYNKYDRNMPPHATRGRGDGFSPGRGRSRGRGGSFRGRGGYDDRYRGERDPSYDRRGWEGRREDPRMEGRPDDPRMERPPFDPRRREEEDSRFKHRELSPGGPSRHPADRDDQRMKFNRNRRDESPPKDRFRDEEEGMKYRGGNYKPEVEEERGRRRERSPTGSQYREDDDRSKYKGQRDASSPSRDRSSKRSDDGSRSRRKDASPSAASHYSDGGKYRSKDVSPYNSHHGDDGGKSKSQREDSPASSRHFSREKDKGKERDSSRRRKQDPPSPARSERSKKSPSRAERREKSPPRSERRDKKSIEKEDRRDRKDDDKRDKKRKWSPSPSREERERKRPALDPGPATPLLNETGTPTVDEVTRIPASESSATPIRAKAEEGTAVFSDWSDEDIPAESTPPTSTDAKVKEKKEDKKEEKEPQEDDSKAMESMEYDPISDDELDELFDDSNDVEQPGKKAPVDTLEIDWASLVQASKPKPVVEGSALKRFSASSIFSKIGVSAALAGDALMEKLTKVCKEEVEKENKEDSEDTNTFEMESDIAGFHANAVASRQARNSLVGSVGEYRRALCARRDLRIRRQLCKLDKCVDQPMLYPSPVYDRDLHNLSLQLFRPQPTTLAVETS